MPFRDYLDEALDDFTDAEDALEEIVAAEKAVADTAEGAMREVMADLDEGVVYQQQAGTKVVSPAAGGTKTARRKTLRGITKWQAATVKSFRSADLDAFRIDGRVLPEVRQASMAAQGTWTDLIRTLSDRDNFSDEIVQTARALSTDTARLRKKFGSFNSFLESTMVDASIGKAENLIALTNRAARDAANFTDMATLGAPLGRTGVTEAIRADILNFAASFAFNQNDLRLSAASHVLGAYNASLVQLAQALGVNHFMWVMTPAGRATIGPGGRSADNLWVVRMGEVGSGWITEDRMAQYTADVTGQTLDEVNAEAARRAGMSPAGNTTAARREMLARMQRAAEPANINSWLEQFERASAGRGLTVPWAGTLGIQHGSRAFYLPIPSTLVADARAFQREARKQAA